MRTQHFLLTGATGILGGWVLGEALENGFVPHVLMRDASFEFARARISKTLSLVGSVHPVDAAPIVRGDVRRPMLGLTPNEALYLGRRLDGIIHCAASVSFSPRDSDHTWDTNVNGTANVLSFAERTGVPFYHVSTAYVAGTRTGVCYEDELDLGQNFHNPYERSKFETEKLVREAFATGRVCGAVLRPAIIVGATREGRIAQFFNIYALMRLMEAAAACGFSERSRVRIPVNPSCTKNLVPVDWTAQAMWRIIEHDGASGHTYHLTNPSPARLETLIAWANERLAAVNVEIACVTEREIQDEGTPLEQMAASVMRHYESYTVEEPYFDRTNINRALNGSLTFPAMDAAFFDGLLAFARAREWRSLFAEDASAAPKARPARRDRALAEAAVAAELAGNLSFSQGVVL